MISVYGHYFMKSALIKKFLLADYFLDLFKSLVLYIVLHQK